MARPPIAPTATPPVALPTGVGAATEPPPDDEEEPNVAPEEQAMYERFIENLGRRLASGRSFTREIAIELEGLSLGDATQPGPVRTSGADDAPAVDRASGPPSDRPE